MPPSHEHDEQIAAWSYRLRLAWERRKLAAAETWLRLWGIDGEPSSEPSATNRQELLDEEVLAMWRRGELVVRTGRIHHGNLCVCAERVDGEWCDKCEGYAMEQGQ